RNGDGLRVAEFGERFHIEPKIGLRVVALGGRDVRAMGDGFSGENADAGVVATFREVVTNFEAVLAATEFACRFRRKIVGKTKEDLGPEGLQKRSPGVSGKRRFQRADALRRGNRNAFGLARQAEEFLVASRIAFSHRREVLVFIAEEENLTEVF